MVPLLGDALGIRMRLEDGGQFALSFDDGPDSRGTPAVLEALRDQNARASFFLVGEQVRSNPSLAAEIVAAGLEPVTL